MTLGKKIYDLRTKKGYSQEQFASKLYVTRQAVSKWERDETLPDLYNLKNMATLLNVSIDDLLDHENPQTPIKESNKNKLAFSFMLIPSFFLLTAGIWSLGLTLMNIFRGLF
jgi:transcriptional regulator with XRE-family HTH domain